MNTSTLLLAPSRGLGGGIERFISTVEAAFQWEGVRYRRLDLLGPDVTPGVGTKLRFALEVMKAVRASRDPVRLVIAHPNLLPVTHLVSGFRAFSGATVLLHGTDIWSGRRVRGRRTMRRPDVRVVAVSNFSAGALLATCDMRANVLHPGLSPEWFDTLVDVGRRARPYTDALNLVTAFRLDDWQDKGLETLLGAIRLLGNDRVRLTVCGSGAIPSDLQTIVAQHPWCRIAADVSDETLAQHLAAAEVFVLATRTRAGAETCGEGFGLVLLEAQIAGTPVIAPAYGGCGDAFQPGLTGLAPVDESPEALASVLGMLLRDDRYRIKMGQAAATWSRSRFDFTRYGPHVVNVLLRR